MAEIEKSFTSDKYTVHYPVKAEHDGLRLDQFLKLYWETLSREFLKKKIESGEVRISGRIPPHRPSTKIHFGETITVETFKESIEEEIWKGEKLELKKNPDIVFEDEKIVIISKPAFMSTHPTGRHLFNCATVFFETKYKKTIHSTHRLDRETSGLLILAKNQDTASNIQQQFENHAVKKAYFLIAHHMPGVTEDKFPFIAYERLARGDELKDKTDLVTQLSIHCFPKDSTTGKHAETEFHYLSEKNGFLFLLAIPKTGRQHQIRAHAAHHRFPLLGDKLYNGDFSVFTRFKDHEETEEDYELLQIPRHALHSIAISFDYENEKKVFIDHIPEDLKKWFMLKAPVNLSLLEEKIKNLIRELLRK